MTKPQGITTGLGTKRWTTAQWKELIDRLIDEDLVQWKDVASLVLGHLNPLQVGTSLASSKAMQAAHGKGKTLRVVIDWLYAQEGRCTACGSRLELQVDHNVEETTDLALMSLMCRRDNVIRRHARGGITDLTSEAALMWILLTYRPAAYKDFVRLCRLEGLTMADVRFQEAWAMAEWLAKEDPPRYIIDRGEGSYDLLQWSDGAITRRVECSDAPPAGAKLIETGALGVDRLGFVVATHDSAKFVFRTNVVADVPFAILELKPRPAQDTAVIYSATSKLVTPMPPRQQDLVAFAVVGPDQEMVLRYETKLAKATLNVTDKAKKTFSSSSRHSIKLTTA